MATYVILSRISPEAFDDPKDFKDMAKTVSEKIKRQCPGVTWKDSYATLGRFDIVDIVEAADPNEVDVLHTWSVGEEKRVVLARPPSHAPFLSISILER